MSVVVAAVFFLGLCDTAKENNQGVCLPSLAIADSADQT
jgi:hypothetical protein